MLIPRPNAALSLSFWPKHLLNLKGIAKQLIKLMFVDFGAQLIFYCIILRTILVKIFLVAIQPSLHPNSESTSVEVTFSLP